MAEVLKSDDHLCSQFSSSVPANCHLSVEMKPENPLSNGTVEDSSDISQELLSKRLLSKSGVHDWKPDITFPRRPSPNLEVVDSNGRRHLLPLDSSTSVPNSNINNSDSLRHTHASLPVLYHGHGSLNNIKEVNENVEDNPETSAATPCPIKGVLKHTSRRGSREAHGIIGAHLSERRRSSILHLLRRVSIHRRESTPAGRLATFFFGTEKPDPSRDEHDGSDLDEKEDPTTVMLRRKNQMALLMDSLFLILSGMYGILLVILGAVIPLTEIFVHHQATAFEAFYIYLYSVSIVFLVYVYAYLLRRNRLKTEFLTRTLSRSFSFTKNWAKSSAKGDKEEHPQEKSKHRKRMISLDESNHHTGTFYLRLGVLGFGIGSMIHSGLNFGKFFEVSGGAGCSNAMLAIKPLLHLIFTFSQLYFIFMNSKMCIHRYKKLARFGLMHMASTNICIWFRSIVVETLHEIHGHHESPESHEKDDHGSHSHVSPLTNLTLEIVTALTTKVGRKLHGAVSVNGDDDDHHGDDHEDSPGGGHGNLFEFKCQWSNMMGKAVEAAGPYLYPCTIEYSLMCAGILYVMWKNVGKRPQRRRPVSQEVAEENDNEEELRAQRMSVDCTSSSRGLFVGIMLTVSAIISIIAFYVMVNQKDLQESAMLLTHLSETIIYLVTTVAVLFAACRMKNLKFHHDHKSDLEETLIIIAYTGLLAFNIFSLIASILHPPDLRSGLTIGSNFTMMIQSAFQTIFMLAGDRLSASNYSQERKKPGREFVTFLLLCNFAMWIINTFETQKPEHNPLQVEFYGPAAWSIFSHISVPLGIYYRFHSTVCLSNIWKNAWKFRKGHH